VKKRKSKMPSVLKDLIDSNVISPGRGVLSMRYKGNQVVLDLMKDGTIVLDGQTYKSPSEFSRDFKRRITPSIKSDNGRKSIMYRELPLSVYVDLYKAEIELESMQMQYKRLCLKNNLEIKENLVEPVASEDGCSVGTVTRFKVGKKKRLRSFCGHPHNINKRKYDKPGYDYLSDCKCPLHREDTQWRRLSNEAHGDRNRQIIKNGDYMKFVVGLSFDEYREFLLIGFRKNYNPILLPNDVLNMSYEELRNDGFVIDEIYPRCMGKNLTDPRAIADFLAKVFDYRNTQLLLTNNEHAQYYNINTKECKMLINSNKNGKVTESAKENFDKIIPNEEAVSYMLRLVINFMKKESV
jgi:hypothetical protein